MAGGSLADLNYWRCIRCIRRNWPALIELLEFLEQPHVLNGDDRLVGKGLEECDLVVGEWPGLRTPDTAQAPSPVRTTAECGLEQRCNGLLGFVTICWWIALVGTISTAIRETWGTTSLSTAAVG